MGKQIYRLSGQGKNSIGRPLEKLDCLRSPLSKHQMSITEYNKFDAIIIDHDLDSRGKLKQAAHNVVSFGKVYPFSTLADVLARLQVGEKCDVIFLSYKLGQEEIAEFIKAAKDTHSGRDCAYILVMTARSQESNIVAQNFLGGANGFLFEPYSVDSLREIAELAATVKLENQKERERAALQILVNDMVREVANMALRYSVGQDIRPELKRAKRIAAAVKELQPEALDEYYEMLIESFIKAPPPATPSYFGASRRVKQRLAQRAREQRLKDLKEV